MKDNIFSYSGSRGELVSLFYKLLLTREVISYEDVLTAYDGGVLSSQKITGHDSYKVLKHVVPDVVTALRQHGYEVISLPNGRTTSYQYVGADKDPLHNMRFAALVEERYNILQGCIESKSAVKICYKPFDRSKMEVVFHPHLLREYNGRKFAVGISEKEGKEPLRRFAIALDRIKGEINMAHSDHPYIAAEANEYSYFSHLVGMRLEPDAELTTIRIRALDRYTFGRLVTKPLHESQKVIEYPNWDEGRDYGEIEITVYPNVELQGQILSYSSTIEIISPESYRLQIINELKSQLSLYQNGSLY